MSIIKGMLFQIGQLRWSLLVTFGVSIATVSIFAGVAAYYDISFAYFARDPAITLYGHPLTGALSHIGILIWCATVAICLFCAAVHRRYGRPGFARFMVYSALLTALLMLDDLFMLHEYILPLSLGVPQNGVYGAYLVLVIVYVLGFRRTLLTLEYSIFLMACGWLGLSLLTDLLLAQSELQFFLEDGLKLMGIATWLLFFARSGFVQTIVLFKGDQPPR